ncbi:MAG: hypothetical protein IT424_02175 [Pirellulales bacterium]|nr:hypothetical protein [Pirellulales bacterium]
MIQGNFASSSGGGVAIVSGSFGSPTSDTAVINGTTFSDNRTNFGNGGGVYAELAGSSTFGPQLTISASTLALNESHNGGGIHVTLDGRAELLVSGSLIDANDASGDGAGVFVQANSGAQLRLDGVTLDGNEALGRGGGVHANLSDQAVAELIDSTFVQNDSSDDGGGGFATLLSNSTLLVQDSLFDTNFAADNGGAMAVELNASTAEFARTIVQTNLAAGAGGGLHATIASDSAMTIAESLITGNTAQGGGFYGEYGGGGVFAAIAEEAELLVEDSAISANIAAEGGGLRVNMPGFGHYSATNSKFTLSRSTVGGNRAVNRGGGLLLLSGAGGETVIQDSTITGNDAGIVLGGSPGAFTAANSGGGVYAYLVSGDDSIDQMNPAHTANEFARFTIAGSTVDNNAAGQHGGGLYLRAKRQDYTDAVNTDISLYNTTISGNTAGLTDDPTTSTPDDAVTGEGGGMHLTIFHLNVVPNHEVETVDVRFNNVTITDNTATVGGGVFSFVPDQVDDPPQSFQSMVDARFQNTIVSGNRTHESVPNNVWGSVNVAETVFNLFGLVSSNTIFDHVTRSVTALRTDVPGGNRFNNDPKLSELANFGGPTRTHAILPSSLAIDGGANAKAIVPFSDLSGGPGTPLANDQRGIGFDRMYDVPGVLPNGSPTPVDIGAFELGTLRVTNVTIASSTANQTFHPPVPFNGPNDDLDLDGSGLQLRTVPVAKIDKVILNFSQPTSTLAAGTLSLYGLKSGVTWTPSSVLQTVNSAAWTVSSELSSDQYLITLPDAVTDGAGSALDGDWTNPFSLHTTNLAVSEFPSGDGAPGGAFKFVFTVLKGDATLDNEVGTFEFLLFQRFYNETGHTFTECEFTGDSTGLVNANDFSVWSSQYGKKLIDLVFADFNGDKVVDGLDFTIWQSHFGQTGVTHNDGDADNDGDVDNDDQAILNNQMWRVAFDYVT